MNKKNSIESILGFNKTLFVTNLYENIKKLERTKGYA